MHAQLKISLGQSSDKGIKQRNEDFYGAYLPEDSTLDHNPTLFWKFVNGILLLCHLGWLITFIS